MRVLKRAHNCREDSNQREGVSCAAQDFLVRGLIGFDQATGAMAIGEGVRVGQRMRFMVRDREGAMQDLTDHALAIKRRQLQVEPKDTLMTARWLLNPALSQSVQKCSAMLPLQTSAGLFQ